MSDDQQQEITELRTEIRQLRREKDALAVDAGGLRAEIATLEEVLAGTQAAIRTLVRELLKTTVAVLADGDPFAAGIEDLLADVAGATQGRLVHEN